MLLIITPAFLGRFVYFLYHWKENTLQFTYSTYNLDDVITASPCTPQKFTSHSYFLTLTKFKYIEFICENVKKKFCQKTDKKFIQKIKKMNIRWLSAKVANNGFDRTHSRKRSATVVSKCDVFTLGSVETQLGWCCKFC